MKDSEVLPDKLRRLEEEGNLDRTPSLDDWGDWHLERGGNLPGLGYLPSKPSYPTPAGRTLSALDQHD